MKKKLFLPILSAVLVCALLSFLYVKAAFNPNRIIDDAVFSNSSSMSATQIDNFLNTFPNSCISPNSGFEAKVPAGYSPSAGFSYGNFTTAGHVIATSAQVYGINPQVLLVTLQKEQSLVIGGASYCGNGDEHKYAAAMGYGCPDSGGYYNYSGVSLYRRWGGEHTVTGQTCVNSSSKAGFSQQVIRAAWLLKFGQQRSLGNVGWAVIVGPWNNSDDPQTCYGGPMTTGWRQVCPSGPTNFYDGYKTIDGVAVNMNTGATAALYWYTPHFHGNENFSNLFSSWFGSLYANAYDASPVNQSAYPTIQPNGQVTVFMSYQNTGTSTWYDDQGLSGAPGGTPPVHLGTSHPLNRGSAFSNGWPTGNRPALNFAAVYEADGTTLASNQHAAVPGQVAKFSFTLSSPWYLSPGTSREFFQPVAEGVGSGGFNDTWSFLDVSVASNPSLAWYSQSDYPTILPGDKTESSITFTNNGNAVLYDDAGLGGAPGGTYPVHLATDNPLNRASVYNGDWPTSSRPALNFGAVYNSDGSLTHNQHAVGPGQRVKFNFNLTSPDGQAANSYSEYFKPVLEGTGDGGFAGVGAFTVIAVPTAATVKFTSLPNPAQLTSNNPGTVNVTIKNTGNATLTGATTKLVTSNGTPFKDNTWVDNTTIKSTIGADLASLATRNLSFTVLSPDSGSWPNTPFNLSLQNGSSQTIPLSSTSMPISLAEASYQSSNMGQSGYPAFTYGQTYAAFFKYKNTGNQYWYDSTSLLSAATRNPFAVHLATGDPLNRNSLFASGWPSANRPAINFNAVYEADGTTLAADQHVVAPGQIGKYQFTMDPIQAAPGYYREFFQPIAEGTSGRFNKAWTFIDLTVEVPRYAAANHSQSNYPTISRGSSSTIFFKYKNNGNAPWYDETGKSQGPWNAYPVHFATSHNLNRSSSFSTGWPTGNRPALNFTAVYEADGTTLAGNQHVAQPGQVVRFEAVLNVPSDLTPGVYREFFNPVGEGSPDGAFNDMWTFVDVTVN